MLFKFYVIGFDKRKKSIYILGKTISCSGYKSPEFSKMSPLWRCVFYEWFFVFVHSIQWMNSIKS